jgi:hypothetical protein
VEDAESVALAEADADGTEDDMGGNENGTEADTEGGTEADAETDAEGGTEADVETDAEGGTEAIAEAETGAEADAEGGTEADLVADLVASLVAGLVPGLRVFPNSEVSKVKSSSYGPRKRNLRNRFSTTGVGAAARSEIGGKGGDAMVREQSQSWRANPRSSEVSKVLLGQRGRGGTDEQEQWQQH